ncbi:MAG: ethylbenzene dehydrogenase-related protein [Planctomycetota bacterium]
MREGKRAAGAALALAVMIVGGCTRPPGTGSKGPHGERDRPKVVAAAVEAIGDWGKIKGVTLALKPTVEDCDKGHLGAVDAVVKAQHTVDTIAIRVSWPDATKSDTHKSFVWDEASKAYKRGSDREDRVSLMFDMDGDFSSCMLDGKAFRADVWHWKAARTGPAGLAHDKYHVYGLELKGAHPGSKQFENDQGKKVYIARPSDGGDKLYSAAKAPGTKIADRTPGYVVNPAATGSIADVKAEAVHDGAGWTVTMTRKLDTGHDDDAIFKKGESYGAAVACFDRSGDDHHSTAGFELVME